MATKTPNQETTETDQNGALDDELLYAEDASGERIPDANIGLLASTPKILEFKALGERHRVEVRFDQVSYDARRLPGQIAEQMSAAAGIQDAGANLEAAVALDRQIVESRDFQVARAELALLATTSDSKGRKRVSVPFLREMLGAQTLAGVVLNTSDETSMIYARVYVATVCDAVRDFFG